MEIPENLISKERIKKLNNNNSLETVDFIRKFLVESVMETGGHLSSNLGVVELTLALHKVFDFPYDKIIFDVGHQSYVHKILSGRYNDFKTLRKLDGISGFPKTSESEYDSFNTGHSSTSVSAALGMARSRDLNGDSYKVIAFIGDGAIGGGMAFEALNDVGNSDTDMIIVLNDNEMSINRNVGGLSSHLSMLRLNKKYLNAKTRTSSFLSKTGIVGKKIINFVKYIKKGIKGAAISVPMFEDLGLTYIGIIDGHDIDDLTNAFEKAKNTKGPVIIHTFTKKGYGYKPAESDPDVYHGVSSCKSKSSSSVTYTDVFGKYMAKKAESNKNLVSITAAMCPGCGLTEFSKKYPERFFDVGIAEQHAVTLAAGLSISGTTPVFSVYSTFLQRGYDQIIHDVCMQNLHVVFAIDRAGIVGEDGETHQGIFDMTFLTHIPNMTILAPSCEKEFTQMLDYAIDKCSGPVAVRYPKAAINSRNCTDFTDCNAELVFDKGNDVLIISVGRMLECSIEVSTILAENGIGSKVINLRSVKPFDYNLITESIKNARLVITIEDNVINGGAGQYIANNIPREFKSKIINAGYDDCFVCQGTQKELFERYKLNANDISRIILKEFDTNEQ